MVTMAPKPKLSRCKHNEVECIQIRFLPNEDINIDALIICNLGIGISSDSNI